MFVREEINTGLLEVVVK